jgi:hypothetical protein
VAQLQPHRDAEQLPDDMYNMMIEGKKRQYINQAMMEAGISAASLDPTTHRRAGVGGGLLGP